jgi:hypothetical protein
MMIKDLEVAQDLSRDEQAALHGGTSVGVNSSGGLGQLVEQLGIGNTAVGINLENQLINQVSVAPVVNVAVAPSVNLPTSVNVLNFHA